MLTATLYKTSNCPWCLKALELLKMRGFKVKEVLVGNASPEGTVELIKVSGVMKVPVIDIGGKIFIGYDALAKEYGFA